MADERTIILHYHLFKNAGTSVDAILKRNFGDRWVTREFPVRGGNNTALVEDWIRETPEAVAYSSHTMVGPLPRVEGVRVISFLLLRDPIERIRSAYRFERTQAADTWGARLAKELDFEGYVRARLDRPGDRQCRNFQTHRLASMVPGAGTELERAQAAIRQLSVVGLVSDLGAAMADLARLYSGESRGFGATDVRANQSRGLGSEIISPEFAELLRDANCLDMSLVRSRTKARLANH
ncbi:sulfotransferase family 2 domain-containing protein [Roseicyclus persicicus]|uniref:Sulfotransferase family protein n=1 Tax=Roseicyclus persicicus TaxID=2650661 RepID=A0A7X6GZV9_9RHOB|nr:sulfotransferase family 2 domain-containing protein [Roseibacterium persicicum]NKX45444.1 sulfotransferase family protein [Roseibacterium persicicum]